jgi:electron transport complex protein RnfC
MNLRNLFRRNTFEHGVHPAEHKELTCGLPIRRLPFAPQLIVPLSQHAGAPSVPLVQAGQEVVRGEPIARADGFMSVPMHAPATGKVEAIQLMPSARGPKTPCILLHVYAGSSQDVLYGTTRDIDNMTPDEIIQAVQDSGMVGLGGAAFPTHVKMKPPAEHNVDTLVVNGCECEPYLTCDHRLMLEHTDRLLAGIRIVMRALGVERCMIGVEDNKLDALAAIAAQLPDNGPISVHAVKTKYPQGARFRLQSASVSSTSAPSPRSVNCCPWAAASSSASSRSAAAGYSNPATTWCRSAHRYVSCCSTRVRRRAPRN